VNGERVDQIAARFDRDVLPEHPDTVVIIAGVNDIYQGHAAAVVIERLQALYARAARAGIPAVVGSIVPYNTATEDQNTRMHAVNDWIRAVAGADANLTFVDTRAAVAAAGDPDRLAGSPDGLHPDVEGYRRMAVVIGQAVGGLV
jgi:lysophospholipase L1-like esterase